MVTVLPDTLLPLPRNTSPPLAQGQAEAVEIKPLSLTGDRVVDHYQPRTDLGRKLIELRRAHAQQGGKLLSWEEIDAEVRERRGGAPPMTKRTYCVAAWHDCLFWVSGAVGQNKRKHHGYV